MHLSLFTLVLLCVLSRCSQHLTLCYPRTVAHQTPLVDSGFSRQEYWSGLPCPPSGAFPNPRMKPASLMSPALAGGFLTTAPPGQPFTLVPGGKLNSLQHQMRRKETLKLAKGFLHQGCRKETLALSLAENLSLKRWLHTLTSSPPKNK